jgi:hypothetical protein
VNAVVGADLDRVDVGRDGDAGEAMGERLLGVILAALSIQFVADGVTALAKGTS